MYDKYEVKESLSVDDVSDILTSLGAHTQIVGFGQLVLDTICHHSPGEGSNKLNYYDNTKLFNCYTSCGVFDIFDLVISFHQRQGIELDLDDAIRFIVDKQGFVQFNTEAVVDISQRKSAREEYQKPDISEHDSRAFKSMLTRPYKGWVDEGISLETQTKFEVKQSSLMEAILFPHYDENGRFIGARQRNLNPVAIERFGKYRPATLSGKMYSSPLSFYLFGLEKNKSAIKRVKKVIVFESEKSVMKLDSLVNPFYNYSTASFGMNFSFYQFKLLEDMGVEEIIIAFDRQYMRANSKDAEYQRYIKRLQSLTDRYQSDKVTISFLLDRENLLDYKDSPIDKGIEVFNKMLEQRISVERTEKDEI